MFKIINFVLISITSSLVFTGIIYGDSYPVCTGPPTCNKEADLGKTRVSDDKKNVEFCVLDDDGNFAWKPHEEGIINQNLTNNGYVKFKSGFIMQWTVGPNFKDLEVSTPTPVPFPIPFPNSTLNVQVSIYMPNGSDIYQNSWFQIVDFTNSEVNIILQNASSVANKNIYPMIRVTGF